MRTAARNLFTTIRSEGALLPADLLQHVAEGNREIEGLSPDSYHLVPGEKLNEAINRSWNRLLGAWTAFKDASAKLAATDTGTGLTRERWLLPLFQELGYGRLQTAKAFEIDGKSYPISHEWQSTPIHLVGCKIDPDRRTSGVVGAARTSPHGLVQEMLNRSEVHRWGFVSNGYRLRILRDNITLTRQAFVEFDLAAMFDGEVYADFVVLWLLCHQSRVEGERPELCWLEKWSQLAEKRGTRVLEDLRNGVEAAINALGSGFLGHPANQELRKKLSSATLNSQDYYRQLLRIVYRILFLFVAEDRGLLFEPKSSVAARELYSRYYSVARLRRIAERRAGTQHADLWRGLTLVFEKLDAGCSELALPALGSFLWSREATAEITSLELANRDLLKAIHSLAFTVDGRVRRVVDYKNLGSEELGSIYEALLELYPQLNLDAATFTLSTGAGNERKTTGSYYTPTSLVNCLLDSALDPVLDEACRRPHPEQAILELKICDPATGSGHFLIAAGHRIAKRLAAVRTGDAEPSPEATRTALRDAIGRCLYGVDINPMAAELCKVSLWLEALEPGKPLSFLDHRIKIGNSLLGATPALIEKGIPDGAFAPLEGDDKVFVAALRRANKEAHKQSNMLLFSGEVIWQALARVKDGVVRLEAIEDDTLEHIRAKQAEFEALIAGCDYQDQKLVADAWCAAFTILKTKQTGFRLTEEEFGVIISNPGACPEATRAQINAETEAHSFFHWHLEFPDVFDLKTSPENVKLGWSGGFDVILGNPPWERVQFEERAFFAERWPDIFKERSQARRRSMISELAEVDPALFLAWRQESRDVEAKAHFLRNSNKFPLSAVDKFNLYAVFLELAAQLFSPRGQVGMIVKAGFITDALCADLFASLMKERMVVKVLEFENKLKLFADVRPQERYALVTLGHNVSSTDFIFDNHDLTYINDAARVISISFADIHQLSPNSKNCPKFRDRKEYEITKKCFQTHSPLKRHEPLENPWGVSIDRYINISDYSDEIIVASQLQDEKMVGSPTAANMVPLYEGKLFYQFDHRYATYVRFTPEPTTADLTDKGASSEVCFYRFISKGIATRRNKKLGQCHGFLVVRDITNRTNERGVIAAVIPAQITDYTVRVIQIEPSTCERQLLLLGTVNSFIVDCLARQRIGGTHLTNDVLEQLPMPSPGVFATRCAWSGGAETFGNWLLPRVLELTYTAHDLKEFARDCGYSGSPFLWDEERRFLLRCELDAAFFHLYLGSAQDWAGQSALREIFPSPRDAASYVMDTFPIVKKREEQEYDGRYRTKDMILEIYDAIAGAAGTGVPYQTRLNPPPADPLRRILQPLSLRYE